jgi:serine/threonine-protein kinase
VLDAGTARIERNSPANRARARLLESVGNAYRHMNDNNRAAGLMREAAELNLSPEVDRPLDAARCLEALANLLANGEFRASEAEDAARRSLAPPKIDAAGSQQIANALMVLSLAQNRAGNYAAAEASARKTQALNIALRGRPDNRLTSSFHNLCLILANRGDYDAANRACETALPMYDAGGETEPVGKATTLARYTQTRAALFDAAGSDAAMAQALKIVRNAQGERGPFPRCSNSARPSSSTTAATTRRPRRSSTTCSTRRRRSTARTAANTRPCNWKSRVDTCCLASSTW